MRTPEFPYNTYSEETESVATAPKQAPARKPSKRRSSEELAANLSGLVETKFSKMTPMERVKKHQDFISALKGRRP